MGYVLRDGERKRAERIKLVQVVDALTKRAGERVTLDELARVLKSETQKVAKVADRAAESSLICKGRDVAGRVVYWAITDIDRALSTRYGKEGEMHGYDAYIRSTWRLAESVSWERR